MAKKLEKPGIWEILKKKPGKTVLNNDHLKNYKILVVDNFYMLSKKLWYDTKNLKYELKIFVINFFLLKNTSSKVSFNVFILFNTVFFLKINWRLKIDPKTST